LNIIVCIKQTFDSEARILLDPEGLIDESGVKYIVNPFDEYAVEEAILLTENYGGEVTAVSASREDPSQALRQCLAMGVGRAVWLDCSTLGFADSHIFAEALGMWLKEQDYDLLFCGKEAIDDGSAELPSRLGEILDVPQVNTVSSVNIEDGKATVRRDIEGGCEVVEVNVPCLLSAQKGLNEPRYPSMRRILQAKKVKIERVTLDDLGLSEEDLVPFVKVEEYIIPPSREGGRVLNGTHQEAVEELLHELRDERKLI
jgi:electron transfer flavoprotein beta subunit